MSWRRNKFNVSEPERRTYKGRTYDSRAEMLYAQRLDLLLMSGDIIDYVEQPRVHIAGDLRFKPDFFVIEPTTAYFVDVKGVITDGFKKICDAWP